MFSKKLASCAIAKIIVALCTMFFEGTFYIENSKILLHLSFFPLIGAELA